MDEYESRVLCFMYRDCPALSAIEDGFLHCSLFSERQGCQLQIVSTECLRRVKTVRT
jgi:hypothetical protein